MPQKPERVLFIWDELGRVGGVENFLYQCLKWLPHFGLIPYVLEVGQGRGSQRIQFDQFEDRIIRAPHLSDYSLNIKDSGVLTEIVNLGIQIIILNSWEYSQILNLPKQDLTIPVIAIIHNDRDVFYENALLLHDRVSTIVAVSSTICRKLKAVLPLSRRSIVRWIPYGVDPAPARQQWSENRPLQLVYLGRIQQEQKRILDLLPFVEALNSLRVDSVLSLIGEGESSRGLLDKLSESSGTVQIAFPGPLLHQEAMRQLASQDIYLLFSEFEGLPISLLEALVRGVVPVVSQVPSGVSEILIDSVNAKIFPIGRPDLAAKIVAELAHDVPQLTRLSRAAKKLGDEFTIEKMCATYAELLWATIERGRRQRFPLGSSKMAPILRKLKQLIRDPRD
jgi:glycosyltransferase involved in cell wall biosynthesis